MKYYKLINDKEYYYYKKDVVYKENYTHPELTPEVNSVEINVKDNPSSWIEVPEYEYYLQEGLPEAWYVVVTESNKKILTEFRGLITSLEVGKIVGKVKHSDGRTSIAHNPAHITTTSDYTFGTEISFDTFERLILNKTKNMEREIIGYKLIKPEYQTLVVKALQLNSVFEPNIIIAGMIGYYIPKIKELGIMDWFEPVYKPICPQIEVNGYKGEFFTNYVKFGCAQIDKSIFINLNNLSTKEGFNKNSNREIESVTIGKGTFTKDQIKEIAEYYLNK